MNEPCAGPEMSDLSILPFFDFERVGEAAVAAFAFDLAVAGRLVQRYWKMLKCGIRFDSFLVVTFLYMILDSFSSAKTKPMVHC